MSPILKTRIYDPVGCCVYCGTTRYSDDEPDRVLGDEHIIPRSLVAPHAALNAAISWAMGRVLTVNRGSAARRLQDGAVLSMVMARPQVLKPSHRPAAEP